MKPIPIVDLHCDLLMYLCGKVDRTPSDPEPRCCLPQLREGNVHLQTLAIFTETKPHSVVHGKAQVNKFLELITHFPKEFSPFSFPLDVQSSVIQLIAAFENASAFAAEEEPLQQAIDRLEDYLKLLGSIFYISLTWNSENRFGGGVNSLCGLKNDGKELLAWMDGKKIALDLSHASDQLAEECIEHIDAKNYRISIIASHSNFRKKMALPRNLPDSIAKEIIARKGLIGLNLFSAFIHKKNPDVLFDHIEHALSIGAQDSLCFGADFFCDVDFPELLTKHQIATAFFREYPNASCYPALLDKMRQHLHLGEEQLLKISCRNALRFLKELVL